MRVAYIRCSVWRLTPHIREREKRILRVSAGNRCQHGSTKQPLTDVRAISDATGLISDASMRLAAGVRPGLRPCRCGLRRSQLLKHLKMDKLKDAQKDLTRTPVCSVNPDLSGPSGRQGTRQASNLYHFTLETQQSADKNGNHHDSLHRKAWYSITLHMNLIATEIMKIRLLVYAGMRVQLSTVTQVSAIVCPPGLLKKLLTAPSPACNETQILL